MKPASIIFSLVIVAVASLSVPTVASAEDKAAISAMEAYFDFSEYEGATILPEQIPAEDWKKYLCHRRTRRRAISESSHPRCG